MFCSSIMLEETGYDSWRKIENEKKNQKQKQKQTKIRSCRVKSKKASKNSNKEFDGLHYRCTLFITFACFRE